jgi:DNA-binding response OmpR family regulator
MTGPCILLVEDDGEVAAFIEAGLAAEGYVVETRSRVEGVVEAVAARRHDVVILDRMLPDGDGAELAQALRATGASCLILMLTAKDGLGDKLEGLRAGADDYITKPFAFEELLVRIEVLLRRAMPERQIGQEAVVGDLRLDLARKVAMRAGRELPLTATEFALLAFLVANRGRVVSRMEILDGVWGYKFDPHTNIVEVYVAYLRKKIDRKGEPSLVRTSRGFGYQLADEN